MAWREGRLLPADRTYHRLVLGPRGALIAAAFDTHGGAPRYDPGRRPARWSAASLTGAALPLNRFGTR